MEGLRGVPLAEIRRRYAQGNGRLTRRVLDALRDDPRAGARELARQLEQRRARALAETRRLARLHAEEGALRRRGIARVAGVDEVGMGPLAGPVVAAAVILAERPRLRGLDDSKKLDAARRDELSEQVREHAVAWAVASASRREVDRFNVYQAGLIAMRRAVESLEPAADYVLVDGRGIPGLWLPQRRVVGGDASVASIAAASIVAKVHRDALMQGLDESYPGYGFARHKGYPTTEHLAALRRLGPTPEHRRSFAPVREAAS